MTNSDISIRLGNDSGQVSAQAFVDSIGHTLTILGCVEAELTMRESGSIRWMIRELSYSSPAQATLRAERENDISAQVAAASFEGLDVLSRGQSQPRHFSDAAIGCQGPVQDLGRRRLQAPRLFTRPGSLRLPVCQEILPTRRQSSISTRSAQSRGLETASVRNRPYLRVYDAVHDRGVTCYFSDTQMEQVRSGLGKRVIVSGEVRSNRLGNPESIRVSNIEVADEPAERVMPSDLRGLWRGETEGMKAEHYLREVRGDE